MTASSGKSAQRADALLKRFDRNGDGKLDDDERADAKEGMLMEHVDRQMARAAALPGGLEEFRAEALQMFDRNRDGRLDEEERIAAQRYVTPRAEGRGPTDELNKRFDQNQDGVLDSMERERSERFLSAVRSLGMAQLRLDLLRRFDLNADSRVDERELDALEKFVRPRVETNPDQLQRHDTNGDGKIDDEEWVSARSAIVQWLNTSSPATMENASVGAGLDLEPTRSPSAQRPGAAMEQARLKAIAEELARRRAERAAGK